MLPPDFPGSNNRPIFQPPEPLRSQGVPSPWPTAAPSTSARSPAVPQPIPRTPAHPEIIQVIDKKIADIYQYFDTHVPNAELFYMPEHNIYGLTKEQCLVVYRSSENMAKADGIFKLTAELIKIDQQDGTYIRLACPGQRVSVKGVNHGQGTLATGNFNKKFMRIAVIPVEKPFQFVDYVFGGHESCHFFFGCSNPELQTNKSSCPLLGVPDDVQKRYKKVYSTAEQKFMKNPHPEGSLERAKHEWFKHTVFDNPKKYSPEQRFSEAAAGLIENEYFRRGSVREHCPELADALQEVYHHRVLNHKYRSRLDPALKPEEIQLFAFPQDRSSPGDSYFLKPDFTNSGKQHKSFKGMPPKGSFYNKSEYEAFGTLGEIGFHPCSNTMMMHPEGWVACIDRNKQEITFIPPTDPKKYILPPQDPSKPINPRESAQRLATELKESHLASAPTRRTYHYGHNTHWEESRNLPDGSRWQRSGSTPVQESSAALQRIGTHTNPDFNIYAKVETIGLQNVANGKSFYGTPKVETLGPNPTIIEVTNPSLAEYYKLIGRKPPEKFWGIKECPLIMGDTKENCAQMYELLMNLKERGPLGQIYSEMICRDINIGETLLLGMSGSEYYRPQTLAIGSERGQIIEAAYESSIICIDNKIFPIEVDSKLIPKMYNIPLAVDRYGKFYHESSHHFIHLWTSDVWCNPLSKLPNSYAISFWKICEAETQKFLGANPYSMGTKEFENFNYLKKTLFEYISQAEPRSASKCAEVFAEGLAIELRHQGLLKNYSEPLYNEMFRIIEAYRELPKLESFNPSLEKTLFYGVPNRWVTPVSVAETPLVNAFKSITQSALGKALQAGKGAIRIATGLLDLYQHPNIGIPIEVLIAGAEKDPQLDPRMVEKSLLEGTINWGINRTLFFRGLPRLCPALSIYMGIGTLTAHAVPEGFFEERNNSLPTEKEIEALYDNPKSMACQIHKEEIEKIRIRNNTYEATYNFFRNFPKGLSKKISDYVYGRAYTQHEINQMFYDAALKSFQETHDRIERRLTEIKTILEANKQLSDVKKAKSPFAPQLLVPVPPTEPLVAASNQLYWDLNGTFTPWRLAPPSQKGEGSSLQASTVVTPQDIQENQASINADIQKETQKETQSSKEKEPERPLSTLIESPVIPPRPERPPFSEQMAIKRLALEAVPGSTLDPCQRKSAGEVQLSAYLESGAKVSLALTATVETGIEGFYVAVQVPLGGSLAESGTALLTGLTYAAPVVILILAVQIGRAMHEKKVQKHIAEDLKVGFKEALKVDHAVRDFAHFLEGFQNGAVDQDAFLKGANDLIQKSLKSSAHEGRRARYAGSHGGENGGRAAFDHRKEQARLKGTAANVGLAAADKMTEIEVTRNYAPALKNLSFGELVDQLKGMQKGFVTFEDKCKQDALRSEILSRAKTESSDALAQLTPLVNQPAAISISPAHVGRPSHIGKSHFKDKWTSSSSAERRDDRTDDMAKETERNYNKFQSACRTANYPEMIRLGNILEVECRENRDRLKKYGLSKMGKAKTAEDYYDEYYTAIESHVDTALKKGAAAESRTFTPDTQRLFTEAENNAIQIEGAIHTFNAHQGKCYNKSLSYVEREAALKGALKEGAVLEGKDVEVKGLKQLKEIEQKYGTVEQFENTIVAEKKFNAATNVGNNPKSSPKEVVQAQEDKYQATLILIKNKNSQEDQELFKGVLEKRQSTLETYGSMEQYEKVLVAEEKFNETAGVLNNKETPYSEKQKAWEARVATALILEKYETSEKDKKLYGEVLERQRLIVEKHGGSLEQHDLSRAAEAIEKEANAVLADPKASLKDQEAASGKRYQAYLILRKNVNSAADQIKFDCEIAVYEQNTQRRTNVAETWKKLSEENEKLKKAVKKKEIKNHSIAACEKAQQLLDEGFCELDVMRDLNLSPEEAKKVIAQVRKQALFKTLNHYSERVQCVYATTGVRLTADLLHDVARKTRSRPIKMAAQTLTSIHSVVPGFWPAAATAVVGYFAGEEPEVMGELYGRVRSSFANHAFSSVLHPHEAWEKAKTLNRKATLLQGANSAFQLTASAVQLAAQGASAVPFLRVSKEAANRFNATVSGVAQTVNFSSNTVFNGIAVYQSFRYLRAGTFTSKIHKVGEGWASIILGGFDAYEFCATESEEGSFASKIQSCLPDFRGNLPENWWYYAAKDLSLATAFAWFKNSPQMESLAFYRLGSCAMKIFRGRYKEDVLISIMLNCQYFAKLAPSPERNAALESSMRNLLHNLDKSYAIDISVDSPAIERAKVFYFEHHLHDLLKNEKWVEVLKVTQVQNGNFTKLNGPVTLALNAWFVRATAQIGRLYQIHFSYSEVIKALEEADRLKNHLAQQENLSEQMRREVQEKIDTQKQTLLTHFCSFYIASNERYNPLLALNLFEKISVQERVQGEHWYAIGRIAIELSEYSEPRNLDLLALARGCFFFLHNLLVSKPSLTENEKRLGGKCDELLQFFKGSMGDQWEEIVHIQGNENLRNLIHLILMKDVKLSPPCIKDNPPRLHNFANICFMNAALQFLLNDQTILDAIESLLPTIKDATTRRFLNVLKEMYALEKINMIALLRFHAACSEMGFIGKMGRHEDAQELLIRITGLFKDVPTLPLDFIPGVKTLDGMLGNLPKIEGQPQYIYMFLKRFSMDEKTGIVSKNESAVILPPRGRLDLSHLFKDAPKRIYEIVGRINHTGTLEEGHYTTDLRKNSRWLHIDDEIISSQQEFFWGDDQDKSAYIFVLRACSDIKGVSNDYP